MEVKSQEELELSHDLAETVKCELDEPSWSVVSFDKCEANGLTYAQAAVLMAELDFHGVAGLCIVTDEAAANVHPG